MDAFAGAIGVSESDGKCTGEYAVCNTFNERYENRYFSHVLREMALQGYIYVICPSVRERAPRFRYARLKDVFFPVPPESVQTEIVDFLDRKTAAIDAVIEKKKTLLSLLAEKRAAIINQAVTMGLDPNVPMKDSGVPWIGKIPAHWEATRIKQLVSFTTSGSRGWAEYYTEDNACPVFLQSGNLGNELELDWSSKQHVSPPKGSEGERTRLKEGDVLICITGAKTGNVAWANELFTTTYINQHVALLRPLRSIVNGRYLAFALKSHASSHQLVAAQYGGTKQGLGLEDVRDVWVGLPPRAEQDDLLNNLSGRLEESVEISDRVGRQIQLLAECRQALIAAAVAGQIGFKGQAV